MVSRNEKVHYSAGYLFFCWLSLGLVVWPRLGDPYTSQNPREVCVSHSPGRILGCAYIICSYDQIKFFCITLCGLITFSTHSCQVLYSFYANLLRSLIMLLIVSSLSLHNPHLLFCCVLLWCSSYGVVSWCYQKRFSFSPKVSFSEPCPRYLVKDFACLSLEISTFLFSAYFCSACVQTSDCLEPLFRKPDVKYL